MSPRAHRIGDPCGPECRPVKHVPDPCQEQWWTLWDAAQALRGEHRQPRRDILAEVRRAMDEEQESPGGRAVAS